MLQGEKVGLSCPAFALCKQPSSLVPRRAVQSACIRPAPLTLGGVLLLRLGGLRAGLLAGDDERRRGGLRPYPGRPGGLKAPQHTTQQPGGEYSTTQAKHCKQESRGCTIADACYM